MNRSVMAILLVALLGASSIAVGYAYSAELTTETVIESGDAEYCTVSMLPSKVSISGNTGTTHWISTDGTQTPYSLTYEDKNRRDGVVNMTVSFSNVLVTGSDPILKVLLKNGDTIISSGSVALTKSQNNIVSDSFDICGLGKLTYGTTYSVYLSIVTSDEGTVTINDDRIIRITANAYALGVSS